MTMDVDDAVYSLGSSPSGAVEPRPIFRHEVAMESGLRLTPGDADGTADQDDLDTWWAQVAGEGRMGP